MPPVETHVRKPIRLLVQVVALWAFSLAGAPNAFAQTKPDDGPTGALERPAWRIAVGRDEVSLRDIARTGTPMDASPVKWIGAGPGILVQHSRLKGRRAHRFEFSATRASHFEYETPIESIARPTNDSFVRLAGQYEHRRYLSTNLLVRGLDLGAGVQAGVSQSWLTRHVSDAIEASESQTSFAPALAATLRFHRGSGFNAEVAWVNGGHISRSRERHTADAAASRVRWGGGWLTDLVLAADIGLSRRTALLIHYLRSDGGLLSSHRNFTSARRSLSVGVMYAK